MNENEKKETQQVQTDISIAVAFGRPRLVIKDHRSHSITQYEVASMETISVDGKEAGWLIKANEVVENVNDENVVEETPEQAVEEEMKE